MEEAPSFSDAEIFLVRALKGALASVSESYVVALGGLPGAGKTTLARKLKSYFGERALHISEDDFLAVPTAQRKVYLQTALETGDEAQLRVLARPKDPSLNPYADPLSWYDWSALRACLAMVRRGQTYERANAWDQKTGQCDRHVLYGCPSLKPFPIFIDANNPLEYEGYWDVLVYLALDPSRAEARQKERDSHRSEAAYLAYKREVDQYYTYPYQERVRARAQRILYR